jgi:uncharacterized protein (TIGR03000 family)
MFPKILLWAGRLLLGGASVLMIPALAQAQRGGGGHGGGGHFGGGHFGGSHLGAGHFGGGGIGATHFNGGRLGSAHFGGYRGGYPYAYSQRRYGNHYYGRFGYYGYNPYFYGVYPYLWSGAVYGLGYYGLYGSQAPSYPRGALPATPPAIAYQPDNPPVTAMTVAPDGAPPQPANIADVTVSLPTDAEIWFEGVKTTTSGSVRDYQTPPLTPGSRYTYEVKARWKENGHEVTQTQEVFVTAGAHVNVSFPASPAIARSQAAGG